MTNAVREVAALLEHAGVEYALIAGHAVNVWLEPRFTQDIDITVQVGPGEMTQLIETLATAGLSVVTRFGSELPSGPDFVRITSMDRRTIIELQTSKTAFQREVIERARQEHGLSVATPEDLIVMKLIADRPKDQIDVLGLLRLPGLNWEYIESWAQRWSVNDRLARLRAVA